MARFLKSQKLWMIVFPILTFLISVALLMVYNLNQELLLPSKNWSRSIELPATTPERTIPFVQKQNGDYHVYTYGKKSGIQDLVMDPKLNVVKKTNLSIPIHREDPFWIKGNESLTLHNGQLVLYQGTKKKVISRNLDGMAAASQQVIVWKGPKLYRVDLKSFSLQPVATLNNKIYNVVPGTGSSYFLAVTELDDTHQHLVLFQKEKSDHSFKKTPAATLRYGFSSASESISGINFAVNGKKLAVVYSEFGTTVGGTIRTNHVITGNFNDLPLSGNLENLQFVNKETGELLHDPVNVRVHFQDGDPVLLFAAMGQMPVGGEAGNIYRAEKGEANWEAVLVSKTKAVSKIPFWLNDHTVLWKDFMDYDQFQLMGASQNQQVIARSLQLRSEDWANSFGDTLVSLFTGLLIAFYAFLWIAPTGFFFGILYIAKTNLVERNPLWIKYVSVGLLVVMELIFMPTLFNGPFLIKAPDYLMFPGSPFVVTLVLAGLAWLIMNIVKGEEWENFAQICYFLWIDVWMVAFLVGPYIV